MGCCQSCLSQNTLDDLFEQQAVLNGEFMWKVEPVSSSALRVVWAEPSGQYFHYKVRYRRAHRGYLEGWKKIRIHGNRSVQLTNLRAATEYEISIEDKTKPQSEQFWLPSKFCYTNQVRSRAYATDEEPLLNNENS